MKRFLSSVLFASAVAWLGVACDASSSGGDYGGYGYGPSSDCPAFDTCETCTPQLGCGWCYLPDGTGSCNPDPGQCQYSWQGTWTWDPSGCRSAAHPTVGLEAEGGTSEAPSDAASDVTAVTDSAASANDSGSPANEGEGASTAEAGSSGVDAADISVEADASGHGTDAQTE